MNETEEKNNLGKLKKINLKQIQSAASHFKTYRTTLMQNNII